MPGVGRALSIKKDHVRKRTQAPADYFASEAIRLASRDTLRLAVFL